MTSEEQKSSFHLTLLLIPPLALCPSVLTLQSTEVALDILGSMLLLYIVANL